MERLNPGNCWETGFSRNAGDIFLAGAHTALHTTHGEHSVPSYLHSHCQRRTSHSPQILSRPPANNGTGWGWQRDSSTRTSLQMTASTAQLLAPTRDSKIYTAQVFHHFNCQHYFSAIPSLQIPHVPLLSLDSASDSSSLCIEYYCLLNKSPLSDQGTPSILSFTGPSPPSPDQIYYKKHPNCSSASVNHRHRTTATTGGSRISSHM